MEKVKIADLSLWESFYWVCKKGSFTQAAHQLHVSVAFLSKKIAQLEGELEVRLFNRTTRHVAMTLEAKELLPRVEALLEEAGNLERRGPQEKAGLIRLTCVPAFAQRCLAPWIVEFQKQHPGIRFDVHVSDSLVDLIETERDLAIRVQAPTGAQFVFRKLLSNDLVWCASPGYLAQHSPVRKPKDLKAHAIFSLGVYSDLRVGEGVRVGDLMQNPTVRCESGAVLTELALQGAGIALRSKWDVEPFLSSGKLVQVLKKYPMEAFGDVYAVTPHRRLITHRLRLFLDFLVQKAAGLR